jgi:hypothetical protein
MKRERERERERERLQLTTKHKTIALKSLDTYGSFNHRTTKWNLTWKNGQKLATKWFVVDLYKLIW